jgi:hypothetical protein
VALRYRYLQTGDAQDLQRAVWAFETSAQLGQDRALGTSFRSARLWMQWAFTRQAWQEVERPYGYIQHASETLVALQLLRTDKETWLYDTQGLAAHAAYALTCNGKLPEAAVALECGVARLLRDALARDRADLERLTALGYPELSIRYHDTVQHLQYLTHSAALADVPRAALRAAHEALQATIDAIRRVPGYTTFLTPPTLVDIQRAAIHTPLVDLIATKAGGLALIVREQITPVWLPALTDAAVRQACIGATEDEARQSYFQTYSTWRTNPHEATACQSWFAALDVLTHWLWQAAMGPLLTAIPPGAEITFIPVGVLSLLPFHAAWTENATAPTYRRYALDAVTITYAPSASAVMAARAAAARVVPETLLAVEAPTSVHTTPLPHAAAEVQAVLTAFPRHRLLLHAAATRAAVLQALPQISVLHCVCHGEADLANPLASRLGYLCGSPLRPSLLLGCLHFHGSLSATLSLAEGGSWRDKSSKTTIKIHA